MAAMLTSAAETSGRDLPGKQNSLKQLNVTQEKINNGKKKKKDKEEKRKVGRGEKEKKKKKKEQEEGRRHPTHQTAIMLLKKRSLVFVKIIKTKRNIQNWADLSH